MKNKYLIRIEYIDGWREISIPNFELATILRKIPKITADNLVYVAVLDKKTRKVFCDSFATKRSR